jgi:hypothetical protein
MYNTRNPPPLMSGPIPTEPVAVPVILLSDRHLIEYGKRRAKELGLQ